MQFVPVFLEGQLVLCIKNLQLNIIWLSIFSGIFSKMIPQRCINMYTQTWSPLHCFFFCLVVFFFVFFFFNREHLVTNDLNVDQVKSGLISCFYSQERQCSTAMKTLISNGHEKKSTMLWWVRKATHQMACCAQLFSCVWFFLTMDGSLPGSSVHGII